MIDLFTLLCLPNIGFHHVFPYLFLQLHAQDYREHPCISLCGPVGGATAIYVQEQDKWLMGVYMYLLY